MIKKLRFEKSFMKILLSLTIPIVLQNLVTASLNLLDSVMVGKLGESEISAVGLSNQFYMIFFYTVSGVGMGASIFMSQLWGKKDTRKICEFLDLSLLISVIVALIFASIAFFFPEKIIHIFLKDKIVTALGSSYLKIVAISYILTAITTSYNIALRSTEQTKLPMYGSIIGIFINMILNYMFIFGKFGAPKMGVSGAALGTVISRVIELLFILFVIYRFNNIVATRFISLKQITLKKIVEFFKIASPVIINDVIWIIGISFYSKAYAKLGVNATATMQIANTINNMFNIFGTGIGVASAIMIGNSIGAGKKEEAHKISLDISKLGVIFGIIMALFFYFISPFMVKVFKISSETAYNLDIILKIMALFIPARFYAIIQIIGTLRGGGDVIYATFIEFLGIWGVGIPLAFISLHLIPTLSITTLYLIICMEEIIKCVIAYPRVISYKWIKNLV